ncbi:MAG: polymerase, sigma-24 subunit, subfamily [Acidobacteria bacterium]|jgi:RNA polymerase sigma-70 factor (ECF subfamily)|nr:polymerase, sigma-24 subunit, subfamily [Acidobacteriota bacterium]
MGTASHAYDAQPKVMTTPAGFAELYELRYGAVYRVALRITGNLMDAEDVLQTVFLRILSRRDRPDTAHLPEAYFRRAAANAAVDLLRRRATHAESQLDETSPHAAFESPAFLKERLRRAIAALEPGDAEMFLLRYVEGLSNGELAEMYDLEKNNIGVRLHRIRQTLQAEMNR